LGGLSAAALWAALPSIRFAESAGRIDPHALTALLSWATLGATAFALRARQEIDTTLGGLCAGVAGGLAVCSGLDGAVALASCAFALLLAAVAARPGARRAAALFAVTAVVVMSMSRGHPFDAAQLWPAHAGWGSTKGSEAFRHWPAVGLSAAALIVFALGWRHRRRTVEAAILLCGMAWALAFDPGAAGVAVACVLAAAVATGDAMERTAGVKRAIAPFALAALALPALAYRPGLPPSASSQEAQDLGGLARRAALAAQRGSRRRVRGTIPPRGRDSGCSPRRATRPRSSSARVGRPQRVAARPASIVEARRAGSRPAGRARGRVAGRGAAHPRREPHRRWRRPWSTTPGSADALSKAPANNLFQALLGRARALRSRARRPARGERGRARGVARGRHVSRPAAGQHALALSAAPGVASPAARPLSSPPRHADRPRKPLYFTFANHMHWVDMAWLWGARRARELGARHARPGALERRAAAT
jgi:hypothetical protein